MVVCGQQQCVVVEYVFVGYLYFVCVWFDVFDGCDDLFDVIGCLGLCIV